MSPEQPVETELVDLTAVPLAQLRTGGEALAQSTQRVASQTARPRGNIGNTGPPGRAD